MSTFQVTARKWRPDSLHKVLGQEHVTLAIENAVKEKRIAHAYLFSGSRGIGKTSIARILSKMVNCTKGFESCQGKCTACIEINSGHSLDVREIDGASNRGIEQIRDIKENLSYTPLMLKYKIFIIDEAHMLTKEASNALLKVLEEPPAHVIFILATTELNKILPTIRSRCQHYTLKKISPQSIANHLAFILDTQNIKYEKSALDLIGYMSKGSMRDAQTILDQVILCSNNEVRTDLTKKILGIAPIYYFENILFALNEEDPLKVFEIFRQYLSEGYSEYSFAEGLTNFLRQCMFISKVDHSHMLIEVSEEDYSRLKKMLGRFSNDDIYTLLKLSLDLLLMLKKEETSVFWIDNFLLKMMDYRRRVDLADLRQEIFKLVGRTSTNKTLKIPLKNEEVKICENSNKKKSIPYDQSMKIRDIASESKAESDISAGVKNPENSFDSSEKTIKNLFEIQ